MKAVMLAAGVGRRLYGDRDDQPPKSLMCFNGRSLMCRHLEVLGALGVDELVLVVGYRAQEVVAETLAAAGPVRVRTRFNPRFRGGAILSLWTAREDLRAGEPTLFMDADVLYAPEMLARLVSAPAADCFLFDSAVDDDEEPVKLCLRDGHPVDIGKQVEGVFDAVGEWPGFLKFSSRIAARVADALDSLVQAGEVVGPYEDAFQAVLRSEPPGTFAFEDISGIPWIEIDFPEDRERAINSVLPRIDGSGNADRARGAA